MDDTDVQATNTDCKPKLHKSYKLVVQIWLVNKNVVPGSIKMLTQEHVALSKIRFCLPLHFWVRREKNERGNGPVLVMRAPACKNAPARAVASLVETEMGQKR